MCGIAGFCINKEEHLPKLSSIVDALLLEIESRGQDSTGMAWTNRFGAAYIKKQAVTARSFVRNGSTRSINGHGASVGILHTRFATQGSVDNPANNHPIQHEKVIGVHNGHLNNDYSIFRELGVKRHGQVDSEAAFALLHHGGKDVVKLLPRLSGRAALAWIDRRDGGKTLHLARVDGSPLAIGMTKGGSLFFASTLSLLDAAMDEAGIDLNWRMDLDEGTYLRVKAGSIIQFEKFEVPKSYVYTGYTPYSTVIGGKDKGRGAGTDIDTWRASRPGFLPFGWEGEWLDDDTFQPAYVSERAHICTNKCEVLWDYDASGDNAEPIWCMTTDQAVDKCQLYRNGTEYAR